MNKVSTDMQNQLMPGQILRFRTGNQLIRKKVPVFQTETCLKPQLPHLDTNVHNIYQTFHNANAGSSNTGFLVAYVTYEKMVFTSTTKYECMLYMYRQQNRYIYI